MTDWDDELDELDELQDEAPEEPLQAMQQSLAQAPKRAKREAQNLLSKVPGGATTVAVAVAGLALVCGLWGALRRRKKPSPALKPARCAHPPCSARSLLTRGTPRSPSPVRMTAAHAATQSARTGRSGVAGAGAAPG